MYQCLDDHTNLLIKFAVIARTDKAWHNKCEMMYRMTYQFNTRVIRTSHRSCSVKKVFYKPKACNFIKKEAKVQVFFCEFYEISKNTYSTENIRTTASVWCFSVIVVMRLKLLKDMLECLIKCWMGSANKKYSHPAFHPT